MSTSAPAREPESRRFRPQPVYRHTSIHLSTAEPTQFVDVTDRLERLAAGVAVGMLNVQTRHTTTAIVVNEHEPLLLTDLQELLDRAAPRDAVYAHDDRTRRTVNLTDAERPNGHAHCQALLLPSSVCLNIVDGRLCLGRWQRVFVVELDGPRERELSVLLVGAER